MLFVCASGIGRKLPKQPEFTCHPLNGKVL